MWVLVSPSLETISTRPSSSGICAWHTLAPTKWLVWQPLCHQFPLTLQGNGWALDQIYNHLLCCWVYCCFGVINHWSSIFGHQVSDRSGKYWSHCLSLLVEHLLLLCAFESVCPWQVWWMNWPLIYIWGKLLVKLPSKLNSKIGWGTKLRFEKVQGTELFKSGVSICWSV